VLIGYMRVSKADGSQVLNLQRDALIAAGVKRSHLYEDQASGKKDDRPGLEACLKALREGDTLSSGSSIASAVISVTSSTPSMI
jgi:DNA invertase Pin-like site-specific DNA recombinase